MRMLNHCLWILCAALFCWTGVAEAANDAGKGGQGALVQVGVFHNYPILFEEDGEPTGFHMELLKEVAKRQGWQLRFHSGKLNTVLQGLKDGSLDVGMSLMPTVERMGFADFSSEKNVILWGQVFIPADRTDIHNITDLSGKTIGFISRGRSGQNFMQLCEQFGVKANFTQVGGYDDLADAVQKGVVDAGVFNNFQGHKYAQAYSLKPTPILFKPTPVLFAVPKGKNRFIIEALDTAIRQWKDDPGSVYYDLESEFLSSLSRKEKSWLPRDIAIALFLGFLFMFLGLLLGSFLSQRARQSLLARSHNRHILSFTLGIGLTFWFIDSFVDWFLFNMDRNHSLLEIMITGVPLEELYMRSMMVVVCGVFGVFFSRYLGMYRDSQSALLESEERFRQLAETIPEVFWVGSFDWQQLHYVSPAYETIWGKSVKSLYEEPFSWFESVVEEDRQKVMETIPQEIHPGVGQILFPEYRILRPDGTFRWILARAFPIWGEDGKENRIVGLAEDITGRHLAEEEADRLEGQLRQARKMEAIGTLAGGIAHDFNNILTPILGYASMASDKLEQGSPLDKNLKAILKAGYRAKELVNQILTFSRQAGQDLQPLRVQLVVKEAVKLLRSTLPSTISIKQDINNCCGNVLADATQIHQIIMNLCTNAYHAMRESGGCLRVALSEVVVEEGDLAPDAPIGPGLYLCLEVEDNGIGIPATVMDKIFEPYFTTKGKGEGTGMGLAVVHGIVRRHRGHITVESAPGRGSLFTVYLPLSEGETEDYIGVVEEQVTGGDERILFVDDENIVAEMMKTLLEGMGYTVTSYTRSLDALQDFMDEPQSFDLVITDMTMPNMTGAQLTKKMLAIRPELPIIMCTGYSELINEKKAKEIGVKAFIMKPVIKHELDKIIRELLDDKDAPQ